MVSVLRPRSAWRPNAERAGPRAAEFYQAVLTSSPGRANSVSRGRDLRNGAACGPHPPDERSRPVRAARGLAHYRCAPARPASTSHIKFAHWLGKAQRDELFVDLIFASGNGLANVDDEWIANGRADSIFGMDVRICAAEEMIWSKSFVMERERFDGADVLHILRHSAQSIDWARLLRRFDQHAGVLLAHLVLFLYVYPDAHSLIPEWVLDDLWAAARRDPPGGDRVCRGTALSRTQYLVDIHAWGYTDARLAPHGPMTEQEVIDWTAEVERDQGAVARVAVALQRRLIHERAATDVPDGDPRQAARLSASRR